MPNEMESTYRLPNVLPIEGEYLDTRELARLTHTQPQTWRRKRWQGSGPPFCRLGHRILYLRTSVDAYLAERTFTSTTEADAGKPPEPGQIKGEPAVCKGCSCRKGR